MVYKTHLILLMIIGEVYPESIQVIKDITQPKTKENQNEDQNINFEAQLMVNIQVKPLALNFSLPANSKYKSVLQQLFSSASQKQIDKKENTQDLIINDFMEDLTKKQTSIQPQLFQHRLTERRLNSILPKHRLGFHGKYLRKKRRSGNKTRKSFHPSTRIKKASAVKSQKPSSSYKKIRGLPRHFKD